MDIGCPCDLYLQATGTRHSLLAARLASAKLKKKTLRCPCALRCLLYVPACAWCTAHLASVGAPAPLVCTPRELQTCHEIEIPTRHLAQGGVLGGLARALAAESPGRYQPCQTVDLAGKHTNRTLPGDTENHTRFCAGWRPERRRRCACCATTWPTPARAPARPPAARRRPRRAARPRAPAACTASGRSAARTPSSRPTTLGRRRSELCRVPTGGARRSRLPLPAKD